MSTLQVTTDSEVGFIEQKVVRDLSLTPTQSNRHSNGDKTVKLKKLSKTKFQPTTHEQLEQHRKYFDEQREMKGQSGAYKALRESDI